MLKRLLTFGPALLITLLTGCAAPPLQLEPDAKEHISTRYREGLAVLRSNHTDEVVVTLLDANSAALLFEISVHNRESASFNFSTANIAFMLQTPGQALPGRVYRYAEVSPAADDDLSWDGADVVVGAVTPQIIGGSAGITSAVLQGFIGLGFREVRRSADQTQHNLGQNYLRRHTVDVDETYGGLVKSNCRARRKPVTICC
ncbi:MAG: hypothetical protein R3F53_00165 [Gammaproteobacteria bacterium]